MGNASCRKFAKLKIEEKGPVKKFKRESSDNNSKENQDNADHRTNSNGIQKSPLGETQNQPRFTTNNQNKFRGRDDAEIDDDDVNEGKDLRITETIGEYNFLSGKGIVKKPKRERNKKSDSDKSTQPPNESNKSIPNLNSTKNKMKMEASTPSVSLSHSDSTGNNIVYTTEVNPILTMLKT